MNEIWRFPVKSMQGERVAHAEIGHEGLLGDRCLALLDVESGDVAGASNRLFPAMLRCQAAMVEPPRPGRALPPVRITLPDGSSVTSDESGANDALSAVFGRAVRLIDRAPARYLESRGRFFARMGLSVPPRVGDLLDACPLSIITTSTLAGLAEQEPGACFDVRRFRMNICIDPGEPGFVEDEWVGGAFVVGAGVRVRVSMRDPRCVVTTLAVDDLPRDPRILKTIARANPRRVGTAAALPCAGVYAVVMRPGEVRVGEVMQREGER